ncbi:hypothetical protein [Streptomyces sp. NPDC048560]|uniref:hypothetical protein n=1 Tax=Streptomyces sp. NPDC048560 TaxID=3155488 RepID=UPI0034128EF7
MKITQTCLSVGAIAALVAVAAGCTSDGREPSARGEGRSTVGAACENGTYAWFNTHERDVLTGVAEKQTLGPGGGTLTHRLRPLHTPRTAVTFERGPQAGAETALRSLGAHLGDPEAADGNGYEFADVRRAAPALSKNSTGVDGAGTFVDYAWVRQVTADFRYTCGDGTHVTGRATSWTINGSGVLECSEPAGNVKEHTPGLEAARLSCGPDAPAAEAKRT